MHKFKNTNRPKTQAEDFLERFHDLSFVMTNDSIGNITDVKTDDPTIIAWLEENGLVEE